jgi:type II secretory pathway component GspD/PulD (secretin)
MEKKSNYASKRNQRVVHDEMKRVYLFLILAIVSLISCVLIQAQGEVHNLDVVDSDIRDVFRSLGELGGYNVLLDRKVQGNISFKITNPLVVKDIIELLAQTYGYTFRWTSNDSTVIIGDKETFKGFDNRFTKVYRLNYANVDQAADALKVIVPSEQIGKDARANQLTIRGSILEHENIQEIIKIIDREVPQVNIEARIEELSDVRSTEDCSATSG